MKKLVLLWVILAGVLGAGPGRAAELTASQALPAPTVEQRLADVEAYLNKPSGLGFCSGAVAGLATIEQLKAGASVLVWSVVGTVVVAKVVGLTLGTLRVSEENETVGLDVAEHGEAGCIGE